jgi:hypothetical protein
MLRSKIFLMYTFFIRKGNHLFCKKNLSLGNITMRLFDCVSIATIVYVCRKRCSCKIVFLSFIFFVDSSISSKMFYIFLHWMKCHARQARSQKWFWEWNRHWKNVLFNVRQLINPHPTPSDYVTDATAGPTDWVYFFNLFAA